MLFDEKLFQIVEQECIKQGVIADFEKDNGKITGRMMITVIDIPAGIEVDKKIADQSLVAFGGSFDFYDCSLGVALYPESMQIASGVWVTPQSPDAEPPAQEWVEFFITVLCESIDENGNFGYPMYTFISDMGDFTCIPSK